MKRFLLYTLFALSLPMAIGCSSTASLDYACKGRMMAISKANGSPLSVRVQDHRGIDDKNLLSEYTYNMASLTIVSKQDPETAVRDAIGKELTCQGFALKEDAPVGLLVVIHELSAVPVYLYSFDYSNNYGIINADVSVIRQGKTIWSTNVHTSIRSSQDGAAGDTTKMTPEMLYEFVQDVLSDRDLVQTLTSVKS